jgi:peptidoglycan hydrolase-like protein with peptidoglycan-binding domain
MPEIKKSVGEGGLNDTPDVALVQVLLRVIKNARHKPYFNHFVTGRYDSETKKAIIAFQNAHGLASMPGAATAKAVGAIKTKGPATVAKKLVKGMIEVVGEMAATVLPPDKSGLVDVNSNTWKKMVEEAVKIKPDFANLRALPGTRMLYVEGTNAELDASIQEMRDARRRGRSAPV